MTSTYLIEILSSFLVVTAFLYLIFIGGLTSILAVRRKLRW
jgi:hypothetical protein